MIKTKMISMTQPVANSVCNDAQELLAYCARVSNPDNQDNHETAGRLLKYCLKHKHWSVFEMADATIEIVCPRDITRQILRHRSFSFQEFSQRYAEPDDNMSMFREARLQDEKNRQNSTETEDEELKETWEEMQAHTWLTARNAYDHARALGIAKEQARALLPEGLTLSRLYMKGSLRSWITYCSLRTGNGTQKEHQEVARQCWHHITEHFPMLLEFADV